MKSNDFYTLYRCLLLFSANVFALFGATAYFAISSAAAPINYQQTASKESSPTRLDERIGQLERQLENSAQVDLMSQLQQTFLEIQQLRGELEEVQHQLDTMKKAQRDRYLDLDSRLNQLQRQSRSTFATQQSGPDAIAPDANMDDNEPIDVITPTDLSNDNDQSLLDQSRQIARETRTDAENEQQAYRQAYQLVSERRLKQAQLELETFLVNYPDGTFAVNAHYWLGQLHYLNQSFDDAKREFNQVYQGYPNHQKAGDALFKLADVEFKLGRFKQAKLLFEKVSNLYAGSTTAKLADNRLRQIKAQQTQ